MGSKLSATDIVEALKSVSDNKIWVQELPLFAGGRRIDFWTLEPSFSKGYRATSYEVKVSRSDFKRDTEEKQRGAIEVADRFFYVTPPGLVSKAELPKWAGLMEWDGNSFRVPKRAPKLAKRDPDWEFIVSVMRGAENYGRDAGVLKAENAFLKSRLDTIERNEKRRREADFDKWVARSRKSPSRPSGKGE